MYTLEKRRIIDLEELERTKISKHAQNTTLAQKSQRKVKNNFLKKLRKTNFKKAKLRKENKS